MAKIMPLWVMQYSYISILPRVENTTPIQEKTIQNYIIIVHHHPYTEPDLRKWQVYGEIMNAYLLGLFWTPKTRPQYSYLLT